MAALNYWLWLTTRKGVGQRGVLRVLEYFGTPERVYFAQQEDLEMIPGLAPQAIRGLLDKNMEESKAILGRCDRLGVQIMTIQDADYPERLRQLSDPPQFCIFWGAASALTMRRPSEWWAAASPPLTASRWLPGWGWSWPDVERCWCPGLPRELTAWPCGAP